MQSTPNIAVSTIDTLAGFKVIRHLDMVSGTSVRARNEFRDIGAGFKNLLGGEINTYASLISETKEKAIALMIQQAAAYGANAVVGLRLELIQDVGMSGVIAYGTAVIVVAV